MAINSHVNVHNIVMCANFILRRDNKYLLLKRSPLKKVAPNFLHIPGGKIDSDEDPMTAAQRELYEETGPKAQNIKIEAVVTEVHPISSDKYQNTWLVYYFSGEYESGDLKDTEEGELLWLELNEIDKEKMFPSVKEIVEKMFDRQIGTIFARFVYDQNQEITEKQIHFCSA